MCAPFDAAYACSTQSYTVALIVVNPAPVKRLGDSLGLGGKTLAELCAEPRVVEEVQKACAALAKARPDPQLEDLRVQGLKFSGSLRFQSRRGLGL